MTILPYIHTYGQYTASNQHNPHTFGLWEEPGGTQRKPMQAQGEHAKLNTERHPGRERFDNDFIKSALD